MRIFKDLMLKAKEERVKQLQLHIAQLQLPLEIQLGLRLALIYLVYPPTQPPQASSDTL